MPNQRNATPQDPFLWSAMARSSLAAASQSAWQGPEEMRKIRELFVNVSGLQVDEEKWRSAVTWNSAVLLAVSTEHSLKALAIMSSPSSTRPSGHDLVELWNAIDTRSQARIRDELQWVRRKVAYTRLAQGTLDADAIVEHHRRTFERARYYNEIHPTRPPSELTNNLDLWQISFATFHTVSLALTHALTGMDVPSDDIRWSDVLAFNRRIDRIVPNCPET